MAEVVRHFDNGPETGPDFSVREVIRRMADVPPPEAMTEEQRLQILSVPFDVQFRTRMVFFPSGRLTGVYAYNPALAITHPIESQAGQFMVYTYKDGKAAERWHFFQHNTGEVAVSHVAADQAHHEIVLKADEVDLLRQVLEKPYANERVLEDLLEIVYYVNDLDRNRYILGADRSTMHPDADI